jgi:DNA-binding NarL/FixJ family response regulator
MLEVVVAVDLPILRLGVCAAVAGAEDIQVTAALQGTEELDEALGEHPQAIVVLDVQYRRADPDLVPRLVRGFPDARILVLVDHTADRCVVRDLLEGDGRAQLSHDAICLVDECCLTSLRQQAHGCLPAEACPDEIVRAIRGVAAGEIVAGPWLAAAHRHRNATNGDSHEVSRAITPRELEVMVLVAEGLGNKAIARQLGIREQTVKNHLARLMTKMGFSNRVQVGIAAARYDLRLTSTCEEAEPS